MSTCITADGIDHGEHTYEDCLNSNIERYEDGFIWCPILWSGGTCEECMDVMERWLERSEE